MTAPVPQVGETWERAGWEGVAAVVVDVDGNSVLVANPQPGGAVSTWTARGFAEQWRRVEPAPAAGYGKHVQGTRPPAQTPHNSDEVGDSQRAGNAVSSSEPELVEPADDEQIAELERSGVQYHWRGDEVIRPLIARVRHVVETARQDRDWFNSHIRSLENAEVAAWRERDKAAVRAVRAARERDEAVARAERSEVALSELGRSLQAANERATFAEREQDEAERSIAELAPLRADHQLPRAVGRRALVVAAVPVAVAVLAALTVAELLRGDR